MICHGCKMQAQVLCECEHCNNEFCEFCIENVNDHLTCDEHQKKFWNKDDYQAEQADLARDHF